MSHIRSTAAAAEGSNTQDVRQLKEKWLSGTRQLQDAERFFGFEVCFRAKREKLQKTFIFSRTAIVLQAFGLKAANVKMEVPETNFGFQVTNHAILFARKYHLRIFVFLVVYMTLGTCPLSIFRSRGTPPRVYQPPNTTYRAITSIYSVSTPNSFCEPLRAFHRSPLGAENPSTCP